MKYIKYILLFISCAIYAQKVTLVHGLNNVGSLFNGSKIEQKVNLVLNPPLVLKPSLQGETSANNQSQNLANILSINNVDAGLAVSYSMGGIVTRNYMKQANENGNNRLKGHISIGSPHRGAKLATNSALAERLVRSQIGAILFPGSINFEAKQLTYYHESMRDLALVLLNDMISPYIFDYANNEAVQDLKTTSSVVSSINSSLAYESDIFKIGIFCREKEPVLFNMMANAAGIQECTMEYILDFVYAVKVACIFSHTYAFYDALDANNQYWASYHYEMACAHLTAFYYLKDFNKIWKRDIIESDYSDGVVSEYSQKYPNGNNQYFASNTSHMEELNHDQVASKLQKALLDFKDYIRDEPPVEPKELSVSWYRSHPKLTWKSNQEYDVKEYKIWKCAGGIPRIVWTISHNQNSNVHTWIDYSVDKPVTSSQGNDYQYQVKAVDITGNESAYSNQVTIKGQAAPVSLEKKTMMKGKMTVKLCHKHMIWEPIIPIHLIRIQESNIKFPRQNSFP